MATTKGMTKKGAQQVRRGNAIRAQAFSAEARRKKREGTLVGTQSEGSTRILIQLPLGMKRYLDALKEEGYSASSYIRFLIKADMTERKAMGW